MYTLFVVLGATGNLAKKKLFPALYAIWKEKQYGKVRILWVWRREWNDADFRNYIYKESFKHIGREEEDLMVFLKDVFYVKSDISVVEQYKNMEQVIYSLLEKNGKIIFYLAISPEYFPFFVEGYRAMNISLLPQKFVSVVFEKPFWRDLASAVTLNDTICEVFEENQIYRIDHYLWKEAIQNILALRFTNPLFSAIWNDRYIDNIQITAFESIGIEGRWAYYDSFWALRDMLQNHLFQVLALVVMNPPVDLCADSLHYEKYKIFRSLMLPDDFQNHVVFWQYKGYEEELGVSPQSFTETFVAIKLELQHWDFFKVPIYVRTGKAMKYSATYIVIELKDIALNLFKQYGMGKNKIVILIQPNRGIDIEFNVQCGMNRSIHKVVSSFRNQWEQKDAYEKLLEDAIVSDKTLFTDWNFLKESWRLIDPLVNCKENCPYLYSYEKYSLWPTASNSLIEEDGRKWYELFE